MIVKVSIFVAWASVLGWVLLSAYSLDHEECWHGYTVPSHSECHGIANRNGKVLQ
jgi:hypothetical protein